MNFYFEFTNVNYRTRHALAMELLKIFPGSRFAGEVPINDPAAVKYSDNVREYLENQKDIKYESLDGYESVIRKALLEKPDHELLRRFEETLPEKSLWRIIAVDREWAYQFVKGVYLPSSYIHRINTQENILRVASGLIKFYADMIDMFKPDVFIPAGGQNSMTCPIIDEMCKKKKVLYLMPETTRTQNYMALTENRQCTFPQINNTCRLLIESKLELDTSSGEKCYNEIMNDLENAKYFDMSNISRLNFLTSLRDYPISFARQIFRWLKGKLCNKKKDRISKFKYSLGALLERIVHRTRFYNRRTHLLNPKFYSEVKQGQKYVYFPLHNASEYSTQVQGTMWINQLGIIEALAKSIPFDWKVVVKEHPGMLLWRVRPISFYNEIKRYSNVILIPTDTSSNKAISNAQAVVTIVGTTGWEAIMRGKPVIAFEENMFDALGLSRKCTDFKELSRAIHDETERISQISQDERKRRIVCLLTAIIKHGFWADDPLKVTGDAKCESDEEASKIGKIIAQAVKNYMDFKELSSQNKKYAKVG